MTLNLTDPPGRISRKALCYAREITRLRGEGYSCEATRRALVEAGLTVSLSTVKREAARPSTSHASALTTATSEPVASLATARTGPAEHAAAVFDDGGSRSSKEIAAAFVKSRITYTLLRSRMTP